MTPTFPSCVLSFPVPCSDPVGFDGGGLALLHFMTFLAMLFHSQFPELHPRHWLLSSWFQKQELS